MRFPRGHVRGTTWFTGDVGEVGGGASLDHQVNFSPFFHAHPAIPAPPFHPHLEPRTPANPGFFLGATCGEPCVMRGILVRCGQGHLDTRRCHFPPFCHPTQPPRSTGSALGSTSFLRAGGSRLLGRLYKLNPFLCADATVRRRRRGSVYFCTSNPVHRGVPPVHGRPPPKKTGNLTLVQLPALTKACFDARPGAGFGSILVRFVWLLRA